MDQQSERERDCTESKISGRGLILTKKKKKKKTYKQTKMIIK